jgi:hypothetical protein
LFEGFSAEVLAPLPGTNVGFDRARERVDAKAAVASHNERPEVALFIAVGCYDLPARLTDLSHTVADLHAVDVSRVEEPFDMGIQTKDRRASFGIVTTYAFKDGRAVIDDM